MLKSTTALPPYMLLGAALLLSWHGRATEAAAAQRLSQAPAVCTALPAEANEAIRRLRAQGPEALDVLFEQYAKEIEVLRARKSSDEALDPQVERVRRLLDAVAQQKDAYSSGLFWYTDLDQARKAAKDSGKPILALRMLGKLTEDCSCANSRFFRTALYANAEVAGYLKQHFVLVWTSERPVPLITIDFGDGRKIERTITGNSAHYILDSSGLVVDALPGLYGPGTFLKELKQAEALARETAALGADKVQEKLYAYHSNRLVQMQADWSGKLQALALAARKGGDVPKDKFPAAAKAAKVAEGKCAVEMPMVQALRMLPLFEKATDDAAWEAIACGFAEDAKLDAGSIQLMRAKYPKAAQAAPVAITKARAETPLLRVLRNFQNSIALDTAKNEYLLHRQIHAWLAQTALSRDLDGLNKKVYAELFLTPAQDPWLGLVPADTYTGLENEGLVLK
ncbi:MAG: hypothetical protein HY291_14775 [Planctomycetes bacterium]|nr:hypothetical protein [Planctomycetota bacterium]